MERDITVDIAKGIGIIFVVIGHLNHFFSYEGLAMTIIYSFHMPLFIFLSGYVFNFHPEVSMKKYCYRRFGQIIKPYFVFAVITFFYDCARNGVLEPSGIRGIFIGNGIDNHLYFDIALWFLPMLFFCNVIFWICIRQSKLIEKKEISFLILIVATGLMTLLGFYLISKQKRFLWGVETALLSQLFKIGRASCRERVSA